MLKTLRVTSLVTVILAAVGVIAIAVLGLKGDPQIKDFLAKPGIVDELRKKAGQEGVKDEKSSPLVAMAKLIALRFDPPPPPKPPVPQKTIEPPKKLVRVEPPKPVIPDPKAPVTIKSDLLATVLYETAPEKSLALLQTTGNKQEWFRQGEKVGHLEIKEVRDGSVIFTQGGGNPQEKFVPAKRQVKSLLKSDQITSAAPRTGSGSIMVQVPASDQSQTSQPDAASASEPAPVERTASGKIRMTRSSSRPDVSSRIQRVRSIPPPASPQEQKEKLDKTLSGIEDAMKRRDESASEEDRKIEDEMWMRLLKELNTEKERLEATAGTEESSEKDADEPAPAESNKP